MAIQNKSNHINFIPVQIRLIPIHIRLFITITTEAINQLPLEITFRDQGCPLNPFCFRFINFHFQKYRDPNPLLDPIGGSKLEPGLLRRFQSKHLFRLINFFLFKSVATRIPDLTRLADPSWSPVYSDIFNYLSKTFVYVIPF